MKNQPHNTNFAPRIRTPTPEPPEVKDEEESEYEDVEDEEDTEAEEGAKEDETEEKEEPKGEKSKNPEENEEDPDDPAPKKRKRKRKKKKSKEKSDAEKLVYKLAPFEPLEVDSEGKEITVKVPKIEKPQVTKDFKVNQVNFLDNSNIVSLVEMGGYNNYPRNSIISRWSGHKSGIGIPSATTDLFIESSTVVQVEEMSLKRGIGAQARAVPEFPSLLLTLKKKDKIDLKPFFFPFFRRVIAMPLTS